jgi:hypothetical protein
MPQDQTHVRSTGCLKKLAYAASRVQVPGWVVLTRAGDRR